MPDTGEKKVIIIAGPNGAGKSTFAREFLPNEGACLVFVNADLIAAGLSPFSPDAVAVRAGRLMLEEIHHHAQRGVSFAFETTLAGRAYARLVPIWRTAGYAVHLIFLQLRDADLAVERVAVRVSQGGHNVPETVVRRRFAKGWSNLNSVYRGLVTSWTLYDNSNERPLFLDSGRNV